MEQTIAKCTGHSEDALGPALPALEGAGDGASSGNWPDCCKKSGPRTGVTCSTLSGNLRNEAGLDLLIKD